MALKKVKRPVRYYNQNNESMATRKPSTSEGREASTFKTKPVAQENNHRDTLNSIPVGLNSNLYDNNDNLVYLESINQNIDTGVFSAIIRFEFNGITIERELNRGEYLNKNELLKLQNYGGPITEQNARSFIDLLKHQEDGLTVSNKHSYLGFDKYQKRYIFKHYNAINISSTYSESLDIRPKGTYESWRYIVQRSIEDHIPLQAMLVIGFSSAIVGLLSTTADNDSILVHLSGDSTTGKTTASMLAISIWGNPSSKIPNGLASTWNATENAMFKSLVGNRGLAVLFDEVSMNDSPDLTKFIYKFTGNKDKARLNKDSKADEVGSWATTIISNGEHSILEKSKKNTGAKMRIIDFYNVAWTMNAKSADLIRQCVTQNYGHAGTKFVNKLFDYGIDEIYSDVLEQKKYTTDRMKEDGLDDNYTSRRAWNYAILMYTAMKVEELLSMPIDMEGLWEFFMKNEKQAMDNRNLQKNAFDYFLEQLNTNYKRFLQSESSEAILDSHVKNPTPDIMGKINILPNKAYIEVCIFPELFNKLMKNGGFEDPKIILKQWKDEGKLDAEADRYTRKRKIIENGGTLPLYVIRVAKEDVLNEKENET